MHWNSFDADVNLLHTDVVAEMGRAMKRHDERVRF